MKVVGDKEEVSRVYKYIRDGQYAQNRAYNILISQVYAAVIRKASSEEIKEIYRKGSRTTGSKLGSLYDDVGLEFAKGLATTASVGMAVRNDFQASVKDGLLKGNVSLRNKKRESPLIVPAALISLYHKYEDNAAMSDAVLENDFGVFVKFVNGIHFQLIFGNAFRSRELRITIAKILLGEYTHKGSKISIENNSIYLHLTVDIGEADHKDLDENISIGVHYGFEQPIVVSDGKSTKVVGNTEYLVAKRTKIHNQRKRILAGTRYAHGSHGHQKKLKSLSRFKKYERNFAKTFNHQMTGAIIKFARSQQAKYVNLEIIKKENLDRYVLENWSYFEFQNMLKYKAKKDGMTVRFVELKTESDEDIAIAKELALAEEFIPEKNVEK